MTPLLTLIQEAIEPDVTSLRAVPGLPALRLRYQGTEQVVVVLPVERGVERLLEMLDERAVLRERERPVTVTVSRTNREELQRLREALTPEHDPDAA